MRDKTFYLKKIVDQETLLESYIVSRKTIVRMAFALFVSGAGIAVCLLPNKLSDKANNILARVSYFLSPWFTFFVLEFLNESRWFEFKIFVFWMNIVILYFVFFTFTSIFGSMKRGSIGSLFLGCIFFYK